uniref:Neurotransmitter-gated ion-channel transmembrane domain-containing protein n=1 Tax=Plectus sambesii TaxID=2011161 RepID=A0A914WJW5_9BILA
MVITDRKWDSCSGPYPMFRGSGRWSCIRAMIVMKRLVLFHIIQTYVPTGMLVLISWMSFWLDPRAAPARISLTITTLLTLTTMSNGARQDLPQVSYVKALDIWLAFCQGLIFLVLLEYTWVSFYITRREKNCEHAQTAREMSQAYQHFGQSLDHLRNLGGMSVALPENSAGEGKGEKTQTNSSELKVPALSRPENSRCNSPILTPGTQRDTTFDCHGIGGLSNSMSATAALLSATGTSGVQQFLHKYEMGKPCQICINNFENIAKHIDNASRMIFPVVFIVFTTGYWLYYSWYTKDE